MDCKGYKYSIKIRIQKVGGGGQGGRNQPLRKKPLYHEYPQNHNLEYTLDDNQGMGSVAEASGILEDNITTLTPSFSTTKGNCI